jgi:hypothetical protein
MDPLQREKRVNELADELDRRAAELIVRAGDVIAAIDLDAKIEAADLMNSTSARARETWLTLLSVRIRAVREPADPFYEMSST